MWKNSKLAGMADRGSALSYIIFLLSSIFNKFYFDSRLFGKLYHKMYSYECFIVRNNMAFNLVLLSRNGLRRGIRGIIAPGDWVKCIEHGLSV